MTSGGNPDFVHGLFANGAGANTFSAVLFAYYLNAYLNGREPVWTVAFVAVTSIMIAAMAEEKTFFLYFIVSFHSFHIDFTVVSQNIVLYCCGIYRRNLPGSVYCHSYARHS